MARFIGVHRVSGPAVAEDVMVKAWESYKVAASKRGMKPVRVAYSAEEGVGFCETEANSKEEVAAAHQEINMMPAEIIEVKTSK